MLHRINQRQINYRLNAFSMQLARMAEWSGAKYVSFKPNENIQNDDLKFYSFALYNPTLTVDVITYPCPKTRLITVTKKSFDPTHNAW